ncbi:TrmH family RNA methyltransferase [Myxococcus sp. Y35]|uniref:TrmH family RNA methyltransferase n=1 Tax=Pseudomyxococcus flavus TaxID=3115648 RepID=UPI003CF8FCB5
MSGGGARYERYEREQFEPEQFLLDVRKEKIDRVVSHRTRNFTVVLDRLEDSFNMAAVLRTCESMGVQEVHIVINPEAPFVPNSRVAQGCDKWLDVKLYKTFAECREHLKSRGFSLYASAIQDGATSLYTLRFDTKMALVFGNERHGVSEEVLAGVDGTFWVPMKGFSQSLNISAAASACISRAIAWRDEHLGQSGDLTPEDAQALRERFYVLAIKQRKRLFKKAP